MNRKILSFLLVTMFTIVLFSCSKTENGNVEFIPFQETADGQWGMISMDGKVLFKEEFKNKQTNHRKRWKILCPYKRRNLGNVRCN